MVPKSTESKYIDPGLLVETIAKLVFYTGEPATDVEVLYRYFVIDHSCWSPITTAAVKERWCTREETKELVTALRSGGAATHAVADGKLSAPWC